MTISLPDGTVAATNCAWALTLRYTFSTTTGSSVIKLQDTVDGDLLVISLNYASIDLEIKTGGNYDRSYDFVPALNEAILLTLARFPENSELEVAINGLPLERIKLITCDASTDFHKNNPNITLSSGVIFDQI